MKLNKKGFMMAEVVVVSAIILIFLAALYISYNQLYGKYQSRVTYYDASTLYKLSYYRDLLVESGQIFTVFGNAKNSKVINVYDSSDQNNGFFQLSAENSTNDKVYIIYNNKNNLSGNELDNINNIHVTFKEYISFLSSSVDFTNSDYVMVIEMCNKEDENDCKYGYLELYDGEQMVVESPTESNPSNPGNNDNSSSSAVMGTCWIKGNYYGDCSTSGRTKKVKVSCNEGTLSYWSTRTCSQTGAAFYRETCKATCTYHCDAGDERKYKYVSEVQFTRYCS